MDAGSRDGDMFENRPLQMNGPEFDRYIADRIGYGNESVRADYDEIVEYWLDGDPERLPCAELTSLARKLVEWLKAGDRAKPAAFLRSADLLLAELSGTTDYDDAIRNIVGPCLFESLDAFLLEILSAGDYVGFTRVHELLEDLMPGRCRDEWIAVRTGYRRS